jgi:glycosyltransferase involved in cell wall biosynthesis
MYQYLPYLERRGIKVTVAPLVDDRYLEYLYGGRKRSLTSLAVDYLKRAALLRKQGSFDLVWIEKELFPLLPAWGEELLALAGKPYLADYDDAVFHNYDLSNSRAVRMLLGKKIDAVMRGASLVTVGNEYLATRAAEAGAGRVALLPTVIDLERYPVAPPPPDRTFTIGWIGSPSTGKYLRDLHPVFRELCQGGSTRLLAIGIDDLGLEGIPVEYRRWSEDSEVASLSQCDVGIMPLVDGPWERGKCGYKLIQYQACGLPVVASPVGANRSIVDQGKTGFLADSPEEWAQALKSLRDDAALRRGMGEAGRSKVEQQYCLQVTAPRLAELMLGLRR